ncbi:MAG: hypothetical protein WD708_09570 [Kiritimatiellia bacterium]
MERIRSLYRWSLIALPCGVLLLSGCATPRGRTVGPTSMQMAQESYAPEDQLKVGIQVFHEGDISAKAMEDQHSTGQIRQSEVQFMPYHLKKTLDQTGFWGEVRVVPENALGLDVVVSGTVRSSNGEELVLDVQVTDSLGYVWIDRVYRDRLGHPNYEEIEVGKRDPFQNIYNAIANDMAAVRRRMEPLQLKRLRRTTQLLFAADLLPDVYGAYVRKGENGKTELLRLPAEDDPMWIRVNQISTRNEMYFGALNATYEPFYQELWRPYSDWRRYNMVERMSIRQARSDSMKQTAAGIIMIAAAILLEVNDVDNASTIRDVLVIGGSQVVINGVNISKRADIHRETLRELSESFSSDARTVRVQLEGQTVALTGSVEEQMTQWKDLLRRLYAEENVFPADEGE